jgi:hypothetical protein
LPRTAVVLHRIALGTPIVVTEHVVQDREQPGAHVGARLKRVKAADGAQQALLDEVVRGVAVAGEQARVAAQSRDFLFDQLMQRGLVGHRLVRLGKRGIGVEASRSKAR